jgi:hypothetical protein
MRFRTASFVGLLLACVLLLPSSTLAKGGGGFRGGGRSFGGGSRSSGFSRSSRSFSSPRAPSSPPGSGGSGGFRSPGGGFATRRDSGAASANRAESSRSLYERANGINNNGNSPGDRQRLGNVTHETLETRPQREQVFRRYATQPVTVYHDSFSPFFWLWLMDRSQHDRDMWVYNHRDEMDQQRYNDLARKDADLERRLNDLQQQGVAHDPSYTPPGVDQDLMYDDNHVQQVYAQNQPHPAWGTLFVLVTGGGLAYLLFFVPMFRPRRRTY